MRVRLVEFKAEDVARIEQWFDDAETQRRLGGRAWIQHMPSLLGSTIGDEFRGKFVTGRRMWLALNGGRRTGRVRRRGDVRPVLRVGRF